ncbi:MAG: alpha/beta fold hydrolase [Deltaproteobacteria bacterium]|nr:alpha/beta fold hydrolase [Deltaproteobacteria bacterium]
MEHREAKRWTNLAGLFSRPKPKVGVTPADVVHRENKWRLLRYRPRPAGVAFRTPVLLVPSLINRHYVLDLMPGKSFTEHLVAQGYDVFCIDWGTPGPEDRFLSFDEIVDGYLGRALRLSARTAGAPNAHALGYCMGGLMTAIHATAHPERFASMVAVAAPVTFDDPGLLSRWSRTPTFDVDALVKAFGNVPWQLMQSAFHLLRPTLNLSKTVHLLDRAWDDEFLDGFLALETWGNDNVSFPGEAYRRYIEDLYRGNQLAAGTFSFAGKPARLEAITCPTLAITFEHDNIVPWQSAKLLVDRVSSPDKQWLHLHGGHVGAMVSRAAAKALWPQLVQYFAARDVPREAAPEVAREAAPEVAREAAPEIAREAAPEIARDAAPELAPDAGGPRPSNVEVRGHGNGRRRARSGR